MLCIDKELHCVAFSSYFYNDLLLLSLNYSTRFFAYDAIAICH